ncbi:MAG: hypothetical protein IIC61_14455, partial [Proteobacteria bacterium]|nr:hypothetical protein [Pseudomonadota bacterium]
MEFRIVLAKQPDRHIVFAEPYDEAVVGRAREVARVTVLEQAEILPKDDPELVDILRDRLRADGLDIREGARVTRVEAAAGGTGGGTEAGVAVLIESGGGTERIEGSALLLA